jgi:membrane-bound lytic murein transglycosylase MltF
VLPRLVLACLVILALPQNLAAQGMPPAAPDTADIEDPGDPLLEAALEPWTGDLDGMLERKMLRVGIPVGLTTYYLDGADQRGPTYDIVVAFEKDLKARLGKQAGNLTVVVVPTRRDRLLDMLVEGKIDIAAGTLTVTPDREARVDFSRPLYTGVRELLVTGPALPATVTEEGMLRSAVHVRRSSSFFEHLSALNARRVAGGKRPFPIVEADENLTTEDLLEMLQAGLIPATIADGPVIDALEDVFPDIHVHDDPPLAEAQAYAWAFRKGSPELAEQVDAFVKVAKKGTKLGNILLARYTKDSQWLQNAGAPEDRTRFEAVIDHLRSYADRYDFDWLMIGAQGYQESRLDQRKRSPVGAIGVMQVMPTTAKDPNVGIPDIHELESNIHAGVKYLRFLRDRYFSEPGLSPLDRTLFSFAAYNAGPGNIIKARKRAAKIGLDPNVWLDNVEIAAARVISREPVVYVRNIYRYYIAYKLIAQAQGTGPG